MTTERRLVAPELAEAKIADGYHLRQNTTV
jgi:hypothetical protein